MNMNHIFSCNNKILIIEATYKGVEGIDLE